VEEDMGTKFNKYFRKTQYTVMLIALFFSTLGANWNQPTGTTRHSNSPTAPDFAPNMTLPSDALLPFAGSRYFTSGPHTYGEICSQQDIATASGLDFSGDTFQVLSIADGKYLGKGETTASGLQAGKYVLIQHSTGIQSMYWHLSQFSPEINALTPGQYIVRGFPIGWTGQSGNQPSIHLHLELRIGATSDNPYSGTPVSWDGQTIEGWTISMFRWPGSTDKGINYRGSATKGTTRTQFITNVNCGQTAADAIVSTTYPTTSNTAKNGLDSNTVFSNYQDVVSLTSVNKSSTVSMDKPPAVILYENANYQGHFLMLTQSDLDLCDNPLDSTQPPVSPCFSAPSWNDIASSIRVMPGYRAVLHIHNQADADKYHDDATMSYSCNTDVPDFQGLYFPNGTPLNDNVSRVIIEKCGPGNSTSRTSSVNGKSNTSTNPCDPEPPPSLTDNATFISDITLPPGSVVSPSQSLTKTWRVKNTGTNTWSGYNLKFINGNQMGGPAQVAIPTTTPGATVDISVNLVAPSTKGSSSGVWQIENPNGTWVSGGQLTVAIDVETQGSHISLTADPPSPANTSLVRIHALVTGFPNFRALRISIDGAGPHEIGAPEIYWNWDTSGYSIGQHSILVEVADQTDTSWSHPETRSYLYTLTGTGAPSNHAPNRPTLVANPAYDWYVSIGNAPQLCAQSQGDPDNDAISSFHFVGNASVGTIDSGWVSGPCYTFGSINAGTYNWHAQVKDARGGVSDWSDPWHFTVEPTGVTAYIDHFSTASPSNAEQIKIFACSSGHAGVNITLRVLVNDANNGTDSGQWHIIKEQGSPCFNDTDAPVWNTLEYGDGSHLVRVLAWAIQPDAGNTYDTVYVLNHRRPNSPSQIAPVPASGNPQVAVYLNSRAVAFQWKPAIRAQNYHLYVSTTNSPSTDPSPVFSQTFASTVNQYTVNFSQGYRALYWQVVATNDAGSTGSNIQRFGIDQQSPSCTVASLAAKTYSNVFQVNWNSTDAMAGVNISDIQTMDSTRGTWEDWLTATPSTKTYDLFTGQPGHTYSFRCRATDNADNIGNYPSSANTTIMIDPFSRPATPWWDHAYAQKRNIVILNNMSGTALPQGYPIHMHYDSTTTPTAADIYSASLSSTKCDDLRIVYNDSTELNRVVQNCSSSAIDLWFRSQVSVAAGSTDNSSHQLYYGNASASNPPADPNQVWYPYRESDTTYLYFLQEGSGSTAYDYSGNGHNCSIDSSVQWSPSKFGNGLLFNRANNGDSHSLNCGNAIPLSAFTIEFWYKADQDDGGRIAGELSGGNLNWLLQNFGGNIRLDIWPCSYCGSSEVHSNFSLNDSQYAGKWNYIAVTFDGNNQVGFYINGNLDSFKTLSQSGHTLGTPLLEIGSSEGIGQIKANLGTFRISSGVKTSFPYASFAAITNEPTIGTDAVVTPPVTGAPALALLSLSTYPNPGGGVLVEAVVQNQGNLSTQSGFYTDLYLNHVPTVGQYSNIAHFWVNDPIDPGQTVTLTTVITDVSSLASASAKNKMTTQTANGITETSGTLYAQTDSSGAVKEPGDKDTIYSAGTPICTATADSYESDNTSASAKLISVGASQVHNFVIPGDQDWIKFTAQAGQTYLLTTSNLGASADTYLNLYGSNGSTLLASNDDFNNSLASQIKWKAPQSGTYYVMVKNWNPNAGGCGTLYTIKVVVQGTEQSLNGGFNTYPSASAKIPTNWTASKFALTDGKDTVTKEEGTASVKIANTSVITKTLTQTRSISGVKGNTFIFSLWGKALNIPTTAGAVQAQVLLYNGTKLVQTQTITFSTGTYNFTQKTLSFTALGTYNKIVIKLIYSKGSGSIWFDAVSLLR
jgi:murein DD-endopeptidase MepM/ murein hydrolase activator NlpD